MVTNICLTDFFFTYSMFTNRTEKWTFFKMNTDTDVFYVVKWLQLILLILLKPLFCGIAIVSNILIIIVISNKKRKKDFKDQMYKLILLNAVFNILYSVIMALKLINECLFYYSPVFCSILYQTPSSQYFKIIVVNFLGSTFKTCSSLTYIAFSLSRFILIAEKYKKVTFLKKFNELKLIVFVVAFITMSALISGYKLFQYKLNRIHFPLKSFPYEIYDEIACKETSHYKQCRMFTSFKIIDNVINDIAFFVLNIVIDCSLFVAFRKEIEKKKKISSIQSDDLQQKQDDLSKMLIINGVMYVVSHSPEFVTSILLIRFSQKLVNFCMNKFSCELISENAQFFCLISISFQFSILLRFNTNFRQSFREIKAKCLSCCVCLNI